MKKKPALTLVPAGRSTPDEGGICVTDTGTLRIELVDGQPVEVRQGGSSIPAPVGVAESSFGNLLGQVQWDDLKIGHVIGEGNQAKVRKVKHKHTGQLYALKSIDLQGHNRVINKKTLQTELSRLAAAKHPNIVSSDEAFFIDGKLKVLMEYMNLGTLSSILKTTGPFPHYVLSVVCKQILLGLGHLHASGIVHRDIKPSNLLVNTNGEVKISDFGVSTILTQGAANTTIGSTAYMSPERIRSEQHDAKSDIWSVGLTCAECALGLFPLYSEDANFSEDMVENPFHQRPNMFDLSAMIAEGRAVVQFDLLAPHVPRHYPQWAAPELSDDLKDFCAQCMTQDAAQRPLCPELLQHPFFQPPTDANSVDFRRWLRDHGVTKSGTGRERGVSNASSSGQQVSPAVDGNSMDRFGSAPDS